MCTVDPVFYGKIGVNVILGWPPKRAVVKQRFYCSRRVLIVVTLKSDEFLNRPQRKRYRLKLRSHVTSAFPSLLVSMTTSSSVLN